MDQNGKKKFRTYRDLIVWQKSMKLVARVYEITRGMPEEERFGLTAEMRKCAISVPASIAEGYGRRAPEEYKRLLGAAIGFLFALETQLSLAVELGALGAADISEICEDVGSLIGEIPCLARIGAQVVELPARCFHELVLFTAQTAERSPAELEPGVLRLDVGHQIELTVRIEQERPKTHPVHRVCRRW